jgi:TRAP-type C4-dicarboxylate transport system substrate-binding protein
MPDHKAIDALTQGEVGKKLFTLLSQRDVVPLAWGENGYREITNSKRPVRTPDDLKGLKIRVVGSPLFNDTFTALGANPTQMSWADAQPALSTGAVDGQENPLSIFTAAKLHTIGQKNVTLWGYVADPLIFVVSQQAWNGWSKEDQQAVREAAEQAAKEQVALARKGITKDDDSVIKEVEGLGVTVVRLTPEQQKAFQTATRPVYEKWTQQIGPELVKAAETAIASR